MVLALLLPTLGGLALALLLDSRAVRGANVFKSIFYPPDLPLGGRRGADLDLDLQPDWGC